MNKPKNCSAQLMMQQRRKETSDYSTDYCSNIPSVNITISPLKPKNTNKGRNYIRKTMGRKRGRESASLASSPSPSSTPKPVKIERMIQFTEIGTSQECSFSGVCGVSKLNDSPMKCDISPVDKTFADPSWDDTEDFETDFEATDIKWTYSDSVISSETFQKDIYSRWRVAEQALGLSPHFIETQKKGVTEVSRRTALLNLFLWRSCFDITHETLHLAIYIFDKCIDSFQISVPLIKDVVAVSLVLASKYEEYRPLKLSNVISLALTNSDSTKFLGNLEKRILYEINYTLAYPTSFMFMNYFHNYMKSSLLLVQMTNYILELALLSTKYRDFGGAFTAHAAICLSYGIVIGSSCQYSAMIVVEEAEIDLFNASGIESGSTRKIMWHLVNDIVESAQEKNSVWTEYSAVARCEVAKYIVPNDVIMELQ